MCNKCLLLITFNAIMFGSVSVRGCYLEVSSCPESICMAVQNFNLTLRIKCFTYPWIVCSHVHYWQCLERGGPCARRHSWHLSAGLIAEFLADYRQTAPSETLTSPSQERCVCVPPGSLVDLDSTNSNSAAPTNTAATTASSDLWGDFDPVSSKWRESPSVSLPRMSL